MSAWRDMTDPYPDPKNERIATLEAMVAAFKEKIAEKFTACDEILKAAETAQITLQQRIAAIEAERDGLAVALAQTTDILCRVPDALEGGSVAKWKLLKESCVRISQTNQIDCLVILAARDERMKREVMERCYNIALGCKDYGGGYHEPPQLEVFHHGMQTVANVIRSIIDRPSDTQARAVEAIGRIATKGGE